MLRGCVLPDFGGGSDLELVNASNFEPLLGAFEEHGLRGLPFVLDRLVGHFRWLVWDVINNKLVFIFEPDDKVFRLCLVDRELFRPAWHGRETSLLTWSSGQSKHIIMRYIRAL